jgi:hypothetical protein
MIFISPHACMALALLAHSASTSGGSGTDSASVWIAGAAVIVSIALPLFLDRRQAPRVHVRLGTMVVITDQEDLRYYQVSAINRGRSAVFINRMELSYWKKAEPDEVRLALPQRKFPRGPELPYQLSPYSDVSFGILQSDVHELLGKLDGVRLCGSLSLSNGYRVLSRRTLRLDSKPQARNRSGRRARLRRRIWARERID